MAATAEIIVQAKVSELGDQKLFAEKFNDAATPDKAYHGYTVIGSTAALVSVLCGVPTAQMLGVAMQAAVSVVFYNTISTTVSLGGNYLPAGQANYISFAPGNSCVFTVQGAAGGTAAIDFIVYGKVT